jgi:long-chain acyl-CoA synthetase
MSRAAGKIGLDVRNVLFSKVKAAFGGRLKYIVCGGAALRPELVEIFETLGVRISQGYGITECAPLISVVPLNIYNPKSCGKLSGGMQIFIDKEKPDDDFGEIVVKGKNVMLGYYKNEEATKEVLSKGWFYTGDYGYIDEDNYLYITGRKKNVIVLQDGKNVFPEELEEYLSAVPLVNECVVVGREKDKDICITALVYPDAEYAESIGLTKKEDIHLEIRNQINLINKNLVGYKRIAAVEFRQEPFEKTPTKKIKRFLVK